MQQRTSVAIIGAGPAGLLLGHILHQAGVPFVILERTDREHLLGRIRAGVLEQGSVDTVAGLGLDFNLRTKGMEHRGIYLQSEGERVHVDFKELVGRTVTVYGQQPLVRDMLEEHERIGSRIVFDADEVTPHDIESDEPTVTWMAGGQQHRITANFIVGADGYHGVCRRSVPAGRMTAIERSYPFAWLGILADVPPSTDELIYALHPDGFAMHSMRSPEVSRLYLQVDPDESVDAWSDERIWSELQNRMGVAGWTLQEGAITEKSITPMRSFVVSELNVGRLFLAGDAGHIVPPTGAKGLNSAIADVVLLGRALLDHRAGNSARLAAYSDAALARQWKVQHFSQWMTEMLHVHREEQDDSARQFRFRSQLGQLQYVAGSVHAQSSLAEQYAGLPLS
jgi:p-hydroxybenzoate 3-monooxygenase